MDPLSTDVESSLWVSMRELSRRSLSSADRLPQTGVPSASLSLLVGVLLNDLPSGLGLTGGRSPNDLPSNWWAFYRTTSLTEELQGKRTVSHTIFLPICSELLNCGSEQDLSVTVHPDSGADG